ncbi:hypothetical protein ACS22U_24305, partial [Escherichia coli]
MCQYDKHPPATRCAGACAGVPRARWGHTASTRCGGTAASALSMQSRSSGCVQACSRRTHCIGDQAVPWS